MARLLQVENLRTGALLAACVCVPVFLGACAASNPSRTNAPAPWQPQPKPLASPSAAVTAAPNGASTDATKAAAGDVAKPATGDAAKTSSGEAASSQAADKTAPQTTEKTAPSGGDATSAHATEPIIARVAGDPVYVSELLEQVMYTDTMALLQHLDRVVMGRLVMAEARRLRVRIDPDQDARAYEDGVKAVEQQFAKQFPKMSLDTFVDRVLGLDPIRYREHLREDTRQSLLADRAARAWLLGQEHVEMHVIIVKSEDDVKAAQKDLADGVAFEEVARKRSVDPSKEQGGRVVPMVHKDTPLAKLAFGTPVGQVGGPLTDAGAWMLVRVDAVKPAIEGDWSRVGAAVEASLKERDIDSLEIRQWRAAMLDRYEVVIRPFLDLVREPDK